MRDMLVASGRRLFGRPIPVQAFAVMGRRLDGVHRARMGSKGWTDDR